jgi:drug/metabolite transporter (DMT)-like permease
MAILLSYPHIHLVLSGIYFSLGFFVTNYSFQQSSAAFVETVKAAEPITSAAIAVAWGIETLSNQETASLLCIVTGVLLSTLGSSNSSSTGGGFAASLRSCWVVMTANLFFSFRGLQQKLFRASPHGTTQMVDDLNLQYRMQQLGVAILLMPVMVFEMPSLLNRVWTLSVHIGLLRSGMLQRYIGLALVNGFAFASYK